MKTNKAYTELKERNWQLECAVEAKNDSIRNLENEIDRLAELISS